MYLQHFIYDFNVSWNVRNLSICNILYNCSNIKVEKQYLYKFYIEFGDCNRIKMPKKNPDFSHCSIKI